MQRQRDGEKSTEDGPPRPGHISYSSRTTYELCPKQYQLTRLIKVPEMPAWWSVGGSAVHAVMEAYDGSPENFLHLLEEWDIAFQNEKTKAEQVEPDSRRWRQSTGKNPPRSEAEWNEWGPRFIRRYIDWRERSPWKIWVTPDGEPGIELDVSGRLPGCDLEIKAFLDRVFHDPITDSLWILDAKSGSKDATIQQLGTYAALVEQKYGVRADKGLTFNVRKGTPSAVKNLSTWTREYTGKLYAETAQQMLAGKFPAKPDSFRCTRMCGVRHACAAVNGAQADLYDPDFKYVLLGDPGKTYPF